MLDSGLLEGAELGRDADISWFRKDDVFTFCALFDDRSLKLASPLAGSNGTIEVPATNIAPREEVYVSYVEALFSDSTSLLIGVAAASLTALVTGIETGQPASIVIAGALALLGCARLVSMRLFRQRRSSLAGVGYRRWETWYIVSGSAHVALLGLFCLAASLQGDPVARLASIAITMAYLVGVPGRSFASDRLVNTQIASAAIPVVTALAIAGPRYWFVIVLVLLPFFVALKTIATRLRGIFMSAVTRALELSDLANRFDTALNNMPQGLAMFEADGCVTVLNRRLLELFQLKPEAFRSGDPVAALLSACARTGVAEKAIDAETLMDRLHANLTAGAPQEWLFDKADGSSINFKLQAMSNGGGILLAEDVTEQIRAQTGIAYLAHYDSLTGLPNRHSFHEHVRGALTSPVPSPYAVMFIDLDQFKQVNDTLGHVVGDKLLRMASDRLRKVIGPAGMVARFGGDEFVVLQTLGDGCAKAADLASCIIQQLSQQFEVDNNTIIIGASIGIALFPDSGGDVNNLLRDADLALYQAKSDGRGTFRFFEGEMQVQATARRDMEKDLRLALVRNEFELHYQPIYGLSLKRYVSCEGLLRWRHRERGIVAPSDFIPVAEELGLICDIGDWVLRQACRDCATWPSNVNVAVNISAVQFRASDVVASVKSALSMASLEPERLEIEITESSLLWDVQAVRTVLSRLRDFGVRISLDDFGTGYSSLSYLQSLPFNKIKIDRSFLQGLDSNSRALTLLRGIARLSRDLGLSVVIEGVETAEQLALVTEGAEVDEIQGYYFSRPVVPEIIAQLLDSQDFSAVA